MQFEILMAQQQDVDLLVRHRLGMFCDIFPQLEAQVQSSKERTHEWIKRKMIEGILVGFIAKTKEGQVAGSGCLWIREEQPRPTTTVMKAPYLMSIYTEKPFRRSGVARRIVLSAIVWAREHGFDRINLHSSEAGKPLYRSLGFEPTNEMRLMLDQSKPQTC